jgi:hypothetical protein
MDNKPVFDRTLFIPIIIGVCSVLGICLVLLVGRLNAARGEVQNEATQTPIRYQYLGTEPAIVFPTDAPTLTALPETIAPTDDLLKPTLVFPTATLRPKSTPTIPTRAIITPVSLTPTVGSLNVIYDDGDFKFLYTGDWHQNTVSGTYQSTLHISSTIGDSVQLSFVGQKIRIAYQAGPSLGTIALRLDGADFVLDQSSADTVLSRWESPVLVLSSHSITITHVSGGSINLDSIAVIDLATPTPTP